MNCPSYMNEDLWLFRHACRRNRHERYGSLPAPRGSDTGKQDNHDDKGHQGTRAQHALGRWWSFEQDLLDPAPDRVRLDLVWHGRPPHKVGAGKASGADPTAGRLSAADSESQ